MAPDSTLYFNGLRADTLAATLNAEKARLAAQKQSTDAPFWSTPRRAGSNRIREVFEVTLTSAKAVNMVAFDLPRFPHTAYLFARKGLTDRWSPVLSINSAPVTARIFDSIPAVLTPAPPGDTGHSQHYGAGHWVRQEFEVVPLDAVQFRLVLVRDHTSLGPRDTSATLVPYSLGVRNFASGYRIRSRADVPNSRRSGSVVSEREPFATTSDVLGSATSIAVRENRPVDVLRGALWRCEPQPVSHAVVCLYVDARDSYGRPQVVDRFAVDPVTTGVSMHLYYSADEPLPHTFRGPDTPLAFPDVRDVGEPVRHTTDGLLFPASTGYLDVANVSIQFDPRQPFWLGVELMPQFGSTDPTAHTLLDTGFFKVWWSGAGWVASLGGAHAVLSADALAFVANQQIAFVVSFDGNLLQIRAADGTTRGAPGSPLLPQTVEDFIARGQREIIRLGGNVSGPAQPSNLRLRALVLKREAPPADFGAFFADPTGYVVEPEFASARTYTTDNAILRYSRTTQSATASTINPHGLLGGSSNEYGSVVWTPIPRDYRLFKGACAFNPTRARFFKFEFTNLVPQPYDDFSPTVRRFQTFPASASFPSGSHALSVSGNTASGGATVGQLVSATRQYADQSRLYTNSRLDEPDHGTYGPTEAMYSVNERVQERLRERSIYFSLQPWQGHEAPRFTEVGTHRYDVVEMEHTQRVAFFVGLNGLTMQRVDHLSTEDAGEYLESFQDGRHIESTDWRLDPRGYLAGPDRMGARDTVTATSHPFPSHQKVVGLQFASQQTPPVQLLDDPDFDDPALGSWRAHGSAQITPSTDFATDIGTMARVTRATDSNFWRTIEAQYASFDAMEADGLVWDDLESSPSTTTEGGIVSARSYPISPRGRVYAAARIFAVSPLTAPLYIEILDRDGRILTQETVDVTGGQIVEWWTSYTAGEGGVEVRRTWDQMEAIGTWAQVEALGTWDQVDFGEAVLDSDLTVRVIQHDATLDEWFVDNVSLFDDSIVWEFSNDFGITWYPVYDIRNDPHGAFVFPESASLQAGFGLCWRVTAAHAHAQVNYLAIRPWYSHQPLGAPYRETIQPAGPNLALVDHYPAVTEDPRWKLWHKPIPEEWWFVFRQWLLQHHERVSLMPIIAPDSIVGPLDERPPLPTMALVSDAIVGPLNEPPPPIVFGDWTWDPNWWGWRLDAGPYVGPNPPIPSATLPPDCIGLDYLIASAPPLTDQFSDTFFSRATSYFDGANETIYQIPGNVYGPGYPANAHLFVIWSSLGGVNTPPPLSRAQILAGGWPPPPVSDWRMMQTYGSWWCDLGPYTGTNPMAPPPLTLPSNCTALYYAVAAPDIPPKGAYPIMFNPYSVQTTYLNSDGTIGHQLANPYGPGYPPDSHYWVSWDSVNQFDLLPPPLSRGQMLAGEPWPPPPIL